MRNNCPTKSCKYWDPLYQGNCAISFCIYKDGNFDRKPRPGVMRPNGVDDFVNKLSDEELVALVEELEIDSELEENPVDIREFITGEKYLDMGGPGQFWEEPIRILESIFSGKYDEAYISGGIGAGKSSLAAIAMLYVAYRVLILKNPHSAYKMIQGHPIEILNLSINEDVAKDVVFGYALSACENSTFFKNPKYAPDKSVRSRLVFPKNVCISYGNGSKNAAIGRNIIAGVLDEIAFYPSNAGGDRAKIQFDNVSRRIKSRFAKYGLRDNVFKGIVICISSPCHKEDFMEKAFSRKESKSNAFYRRVTSFDTKDVGIYSGKTFLFCTDCKKIVDKDHIRHGYDILIGTKHGKSNTTNS